MADLFGDLESDFVRAPRQPQAAPPREATPAEAMALWLGWAEELSFPHRARPGEAPVPRYEGRPITPSAEESRARAFAVSQGRADAPRFLDAARRLPVKARQVLAEELLREAAGG